jgi:hypothetical protein
MIPNDTQLHQAQENIQTIWRFLEAVRETHSYVSMSKDCSARHRRPESQYKEGCVNLSNHESPCYC